MYQQTHQERTRRSKDPLLNMLITRDSFALFLATRETIKEKTVEVLNHFSHFVIPGVSALLASGSVTSTRADSWRILAANEHRTRTTCLEPSSFICSTKSRALSNCWIPNTPEQMENKIKTCHDSKTSLASSSHAQTVPTEMNLDGNGQPGVIVTARTHV